MVNSTLSCEFSVDRGPDCLFVKIRVPDRRLNGSEQLANDLWSILSKHFIYRLVLEMDEVDQLPGGVIDELIALKKRIQQRGGMLRLCGLSDRCRRILAARHLPDSLPNYHDRTDAVVGHHVTLPR